MDGYSVSYGFSPIVDNMGLQAADLVAHETYQYLTEYIDDPDAQAGPHLRRLFEDAHDAGTKWIGRDQIQDMVDQIEPLIENIDRSDSEKAE